MGLTVQRDILDKPSSDYFRSFPTEFTQGDVPGNRIFIELYIHVETSVPYYFLLSASFAGNLEIKITLHSVIFQCKSSQSQKGECGVNVCKSVCGLL